MMIMTHQTGLKSDELQNAGLETDRRNGRFLKTFCSIQVDRRRGDFRSAFEYRSCRKQAKREGYRYDTLTPSTPAVPNCCCSKGSAPYWSNPPFLIFDIRALWRSVLSARAPKCQKMKMVG